MTILRTLAAAVVAAAVLATPSTGLVGGNASFDLGPSATAPTTGKLTNFKAKGESVVRLLAGAFDPRADDLPTVAGIGLRDASTLPAGTPQYWLVQARDNRFRGVLSAVDKAGGTIAGTVPEDTYMVRATPSQREAIAASPAVRWTGYYQPAWRIPVAAGEKPGLLELAGRQRYRVYVFPSDPAPEAVGRALAGIPGVKVISDVGTVVDVEATAAQVPAIAALPAVEWVGTPPRIVPMNWNARWVTDTGVRDLYAATGAGRLNGAGQTAADADTGLNYTYDLNHRAHINFRDCDAAGICKEAIYTQRNPGNTPALINDVVDHGTAHRKMVAYFDLGNTGPNMYDESSHGSHTAGSIDGDKPPYGSWQGADGMAPAAMHVHQNIATPSGGLGGLPDNLYDLFRQAYRPRNPAGVPTTSPANGNVADYSNYRATEDARTHNNSWGSLAQVVDEGSAVSFDKFVWDHEDMVFVISAGNGGPGAATISSPSVAKNDLSSGASANGRQPMVSIDSMAIFSSHGPTGDGRYGVDLATPGQVVVSTKGGSTDDEHTAQGTSMSAPILTGLSTLVRQYFWDGYGPAGGAGVAGGAPSPARRHNPSAALVKASLVNGAERMRGWYTGDDSSSNVRAATDGQWPSAGQGFGRVNLDNSLYFANDPTNNWYRDVWRSSTDAFDAGSGATRSYQINVQPGAPLDVTLAWTDAPNLLPAGTPSVVNNLDLTVSGPGGSYVGNNMNSRANPGVAVAETTAGPGAPDNVNNVERVRIVAPVAGTYTITVTGASVLTARQGFALAASGRISNVGGSFTPGPPRQRDIAGAPTMSTPTTESVSADTAIIRFTTNEPTTAQAIAGGNTYVDSYNEGADGFPGLNEGPVETSADYGDKPVVGTGHEIRLTGLSPGQAYSINVTATDLASNTVARTLPDTTPSYVYQADAPDIGYFSSGPNGAANWRTGTQMYAGTSFVDPLDTVVQRHLGAWMFRIPQAAIDPNAITSAAVEATSRHNWVVPYNSDPQFMVDLLDPSVEPSWGTQNYDQIRSAAGTARAYPETTYKRGGGQRYAFAFSCADLAALKSTLATVDGGQRKAAFRFQATNIDHTGLFAMDFGFNRRSSGPEYRPRLLLFTGSAYPTGEACDPNAPAPAISDLGIHDGTTDNAVTVTWRTDNVASDSMVLFREHGQAQWTQVGTPARTKVHQVEVLNLDPTKHYEFAVRSRGCNGATTTDANGGAGYDFFRHPPDPGTRTAHVSYQFETGAEGWTVTETGTGNPPRARWERQAAGHNSVTGWETELLGAPTRAYTNDNETSLVSPPVTFGGPQAAVEFWADLDTEPTFDFVYIDYSSDGGVTWTTAGQRDGFTGGYAFEDIRFANPGGPVLVRIRFKSDELLSSPLYAGAAIDDVTFASWSNPIASGSEQLPLTGPVPPPSAGQAGLSPPPTRTGPANAADIAAGTGNCDVPGVGPDLRVTSASADNPQPKEGHTVVFTATVTNSGTSAAGPSKTEFLLDGTTVIGLVDTPAIPAGGSATVTKSMDTHQVRGQHQIRITADRNAEVAETNELNNTALLTIDVKGNKVQNSSFETSNQSGTGPDAWTGSSTGAGSAAWSSGGSYGTHSVTITGNGGSVVVSGSPAWTSAPIGVTVGETLDLETAVRAVGSSTPATGGLVYLGPLGNVVDTVTLLTAPLSTNGFQTLTRSVTIPAGVANVRVVLKGFAPTDTATQGTVTFDEVGLYAH
jgi:hypothetical protein